MFWASFSYIWQRFLHYYQCNCVPQTLTFLMLGTNKRQIKHHKKLSRHSLEVAQASVTTSRPDPCRPPTPSWATGQVVFKSAAKTVLPKVRGRVSAKCIIASSSHEKRFAVCTHREASSSRFSPSNPAFNWRQRSQRTENWGLVTSLWRGGQTFSSIVGRSGRGRFWEVFTGRRADGRGREIREELLQIFWKNCSKVLNWGREYE